MYPRKEVVDLIKFSGCRDETTYFISNDDKCFDSRTVLTTTGTHGRSCEQSRDFL